MKPRLADLSRLLLIALVPTVAGCGDDGHDHVHGVDAAIDPGVDAGPRQLIMDTRTLVPGALAEGVLTGGPDDYAVIHLAAPVAELDWNLHGHVGGDTQTVYEELNRMTADYVFRPTAQADWWLLLRNSGPAAMDVTVRVELYGDLQWSWQ